MLYRTRTLEQAFLKANRQFPAVLVTGPRQVGKTSLLRHLGSFGTFIPSRGLLERAGADESLTLGGLYQQIWRGSLPGLHGSLGVGVPAGPLALKPDEKAGQDAEALLSRYRPCDLADLLVERRHP